MAIILSEEQRTILENIAGGGDGGGLYPDDDKPFANAYNYLFNILGGEDGPVEGADPAVWNWLKGAELVNRGIGTFSAFIRDYTAAQWQLRYGTALPADALDLASDSIAESVVANILLNDGSVPSLNEIGKFDAQSMLDQDALGQFVPNGRSPSLAVWSGNPLFVVLGDSSFFSDNILGSPEGTYDLLALVSAAYSALPEGSIQTLNDIYFQIIDLLQIDFVDTASTVAGAALSTDLFWAQAYGEQSLTIGSLIALTQRRIPSMSDNLEALFENNIFVGEQNASQKFFVRGEGPIVHAGDEDDEIVLLGTAVLIDGGTGQDSIIFGTNDSLRLEFRERTSNQGYSGEIAGIGAGGFFGLLDEDLATLFNIEDVKLSRSDDELKISTLKSVTQGLKVDGGLGEDTVDATGTDALIRVIYGQDSRLSLLAGEGEAVKSVSVTDFELINLGDFADLVQLGSVNFSDFEDVLIDGGGSSKTAGRIDGISAFGRSSDVTIDLSGDIQTVSDATGELRFSDFEGAVGGFGNDTLIAGASGIYLEGGLGEDTIVASAATKTVITGFRVDGVSYDDGIAEVVTVNGNSSATIYVGANDKVEGSVSGVRIRTVGPAPAAPANATALAVPIPLVVPKEGTLLVGGEEEEAGTRRYLGREGTVYSLQGSDLSVDYQGGNLTVSGFTNGDAGIRLIDAEPDTDDAAEFADPLIIDLDGDRSVVTGLENSFAFFDLDNDGFAERVAWANATDGLLARDLDGNGIIDNGSELFGTGQVDQSAGQDVLSGDAGFIELALLDSNADGMISSADVEFETLRVWVDANFDALTDDGELRTLSELGIVSISLITRPSDHVNILDDDSQILRSSSVAFDDGSSQAIYDVFLSIDQYNTREILDPELDITSVSDLPNILGTGMVSDLHVAMARDPLLAELVREFSELDLTQASEIHERVQRIVLRWTGADAIEADSRGANINAKWLHAIEQITGKPFVQARTGANPRADASSLLTEEWSHFIDRTTARLLGETALGAQILPGTLYLAGAFFEASDAASLAQVLSDAAASAPTSQSEKLGFWKAASGALRQYQSALGVSDAEFETALDSVLAAEGVALSAEELRLALFAGDASGYAVGTTSSTIAGVTYPGGRILIADGETVTLAVTARDDRVIVTDAVKSLTFEGYNSGSDQIELLDWERDSTTVSTDVLSVGGAAGTGQLSAALGVRLENGDRAIELRVQILNGDVISPIDVVQFADGTRTDLIDLLSDAEAFSFGNSEGPFEFAPNAGDQFLFGRSEQDTYSVTADSGSDLIIEERDLDSTADTLRIDARLEDTEIAVSGPLGEDLAIRITGGGSVTIGGQFARQATRIESFEFNDGLVVSAQDILLRLTSGTAQAEEIQGTALDDTIDGGGGGDVLRGGRGEDRYIIRQGYGETVIDDNSERSTVVFDYAISADDLVFSFSSEGVVIADTAADSSVVINRAQISNFGFEVGGSELNVASFLVAEALLAGTTTGNTIYGTAAADFINGTDDADLIIGLGGNDNLRGGDGNDTYEVASGNISITDADFGFDTIVVDAQFTLEDLRFEGGNSSRRMQLRIGDDLFISLFNEADFQTGEAIVAAADVEQIVFADGRSIDLANGQIVDGTSGDDVLFSYAGLTQTFTPGAGNDRIFSRNGRHEVVLTAGFGHDQYFDRSLDNDDFIFSGIEFNDDIEFRLEGADLVVSVTPDDSLTIKDLFSSTLTPNIRNSFFRFSNATLNIEDVVGQIAQATDGDDLLFAQTDLDGGAGNDVLIGSGETNNYTFGRGDGHDIIREQDSTSGSADEIDTLTLEGLNQEDVSFLRDAANPLSIVITINDTGETLTLDGTPFAGFDAVDNAGAHWIERIIFADGSEIAQQDIERFILATERTDGADTIYNFGASDILFEPVNGSVLDGGAGDDTYINHFSDVFVRMSAGQGSDTITGDPSTGQAVWVELDGIALADLALFSEMRDGQNVRILRATSGEELILDRPGTFLVSTGDGSFRQFVSEGALSDDNTSTDEIDFLNGRQTFEGSLETPIVVPFNDDFDPGAGDDVVFGRGGVDTVFVEVGDGRDTFVDSSFTVRLGEGFDVADFSAEWLNDGSERISLSFNNLGDGVIVNATSIEQVIYDDGTVLAFETALSGNFEVLQPSTSTVFNSNEDTTFIASNGGVRLRLRDTSGSDILVDEFLADGVAEVDPAERGWTSNRIDLRDGNSLDDFEFVQDTLSPTDLIVRNITTGANIRVVGQIQEAPQGDDLWTDVGLGSDGAPDWGGFDLAFFDTDGDGTPNWNDPDVDGNGVADWDTINDVTLDVDGDGEVDVYAYDDNSDGIYDSFDVVVEGRSIGIGIGPIRPTLNTFVSFYDTDGDNVIDSYDDPDRNLTALPTNPDGSTNWSVIDNNFDGVPDIDKIDLDGNGTPDWDNPDLDGDGNPDWLVDAYDEFFNGDGFVTRRIDPVSGQFVFQIENDFDVILARDTNNDGIPDQFAFDENFDGEPDAPEQLFVVETFRLLTTSITGGLTATTFDWEELTDRIIQRPESDPNAPITINLDDLRPQATAGDDTLRIRSGETVDALGGNDILLLPESGATVRFGGGSANDVIIAEPDNTGGSSNTLELIDVNSLGELEVLESSDGQDLVIRLLSTGESIRIEKQIDFDGFTPPIDTFRLADGSSFAWQIVLGLVSGVSTEDDATLTTDADGGVLDGGAGNDELLGGTGDDIYDFGRGYDEDTIRDAGGFDIVRLGPDITLDSLALTRSGTTGNDLLVEVAGRDRLAFTIRGQFESEDNRIERFEFADGTSLDWFGIQNLVLIQARTSGGDTIRGFSSSDIIQGAAGNDTLRGGGGDDLVDGGRGRDTAIFRGSQSQYEITVDGTRVTVRDLQNDRDGIDTLVDVEELSFLGDGSRVLLVPENTAPVAGALSLDVDEDTTLIIARTTLLAVASDIDGDAIELLELSDDTNGTAWIGPDGNIRFRPDADFSGEAAFDFVVEDGNGGVGTATVAVSVLPQNDAPVLALDDRSFVSFEDAAIDWRLTPGFASDPDNDALTLSAQLRSGEALPDWLNFDGSGFTGTPPENFSGSVEIELLADDGAEQVSVPLTLDILPVNDAPQVTNPFQDVSLQPGEAFEFVVPGDIFTDVEGDPLTLVVSAADGGDLPSWIAVNGLSISGTVPSDLVDPVELAIAADDGRAANLTTFSLVPSANVAPELNAPLADVFGSEDQAFNFAIPADTFVDPDGDPLQVTATLSDGSPLPDWLSFDSGSFTGTPPQDFNGALEIAVVASDGESSVSDSFTLTIDAVNDAPVRTEDLSDIASPKGSTVSIVLPSDTFTDVDGDTLALSASLADGSKLPDWLVFDGAAFTGTPPQDFNGSLDLTVTASDGELSSTAGFVLTIDPLNDPPVLLQPLADLSSLEDEAISIAIPQETFADIDGDVLSLSAQQFDGSALPDWLQFEVGVFTGTPPLDFNGALDLTVTASDGEESVSDSFRLTIDPVNDAPVALQPLLDASSVEDMPVSVALPDDAFADIDGDALALSASLSDGTDLPIWLAFDGTAFTGTPPQDFNGALDLRVTASDGEFDVSQDFRLTIDPVNDAPILSQSLLDISSPEDAAISIALPEDAFVDVDGDALTLSASLADGADLPTWLTFDGTAFTGTPPQDFNGALDLSVTASDGEFEISQGFTLTIDPVNDAPQLVQVLADQSADGDALVQFAIPQGSFTDIDGDALSYSAMLSDGSGLPSWLTFDAAQQAFAGTSPDEDAVIDVRVTASDGSLSASDDFTINISALDTGGGDSLGFSFVSLNSWYNPAWGGGYNVTFEYEVQPEAIADGELRAWDIFASYTGPGTITNGWVNGFPGPASFEITADGATYSTDGQSYQPDLAEGQTFRITVAVDGAPYTEGDFSFEIFDRDPALNLAAEDNTALTVSPTNDWGSGLTQNVSFTNTSGEEIRDWQVVLDLPEGVDFAVTNVWGATATKLASGDYLFEAVSSNEEIAPGGQASFGFNASYSGGGGFQFTTADFAFIDADARQFDVARENVSAAGPWDYGTDANDVIVGGSSAANYIFGALGNDDLTGGALADILAGGSDDDILTGLAGDDILIGGRGNDALYGGLGFDTAQLFGYRDSYAIVTQSGDLGVRVTDLSAIAHGDDGIDQLSSIEQLMFRNGETLNIASPIILDLAGDGIETLSASESDARFDLDGDGLADDTSWIGAGDAFLYLDRDGNGTVSGVEEISFIDDIANAATDLDGLTAFDTNGDGVLDASDDRFDEFGVWQDADGDGAVDEGETASLTRVGIASINLTGTPVNGDTEFGEVVIANTGSFTLANGVTREFADAALTYFSAATNLPDITTTDYSFDRKAKKYRIHFSNGVVAVDRKKRSTNISQGAGELGANTILNFDGSTYGRFAPVVLDLDGDGVDLVKRSKSNATFDYQGGARVDTGWISGGDGFLVIDRDNDGLITQAAELSLAAEDEDARTGLQGLARLDSNGDGVVDAQDARFGELRVWQDANGNGRTDQGELRTLNQEGIASISLSVFGLQGREKVTKNAVTAVTNFTRTNGARGTAADVSLAYNPAALPVEPPVTFAGSFGLGLLDDIRVPLPSNEPVPDPALFDVFEQLRSGSDVGIAGLFDRLDPVGRPLAGITPAVSSIERDVASNVFLANGISSMAFGQDGSREKWYAQRLAYGVQRSLVAGLEVFEPTNGEASAFSLQAEPSEPAHILPADSTKGTTEGAMARATLEAVRLNDNAEPSEQSDVARKLMIIRQDMNVFGAEGATETDRLRDNVPEYLQIFA